MGEVIFEMIVKMFLGSTLIENSLECQKIKMKQDIIVEDTLKVTREGLMLTTNKGESICHSKTNHKKTVTKQPRKKW